MPTEQEQLNAMWSLLNGVDKNQKDLTAAVKNIDKSTKSLVELFGKSNQQQRDLSNRNANGEIISNRNRNTGLSNGMTSQQYNMLVSTISTGFSDIVGSLDSNFLTIIKSMGSTIKMFSSFNKNFGKWNTTFGGKIKDIEGNAYTGSLNDLLKDLSKRKKEAKSGLNDYVDPITGKSYSRQSINSLIDKLKLSSDPNAQNRIVSWENKLKEFDKTKTEEANAALISTTGEIVKISAAVGIIAAIFVAIKAVVDTIAEGVEMIKTREDEIAKSGSYYMTHMLKATKDDRRREAMMQSINVDEFKGKTESEMLKRTKEWREQLKKGESIRVIEYISNPLYDTNLYETLTASINGFSGTIKSIDEQIEGFYNVLKEIRNSVAGGAGYAQMVYQWEDRMNVSGLASGDLFKTATRWYGDAGTVLNNIYSQVFNTSEHLNVTADTLLSVGSNYAKYLKASTKSSAEFDADMEQIIHVAGILEDYGINANKWLEDMHSFGKGTLSAAADNPLWTGMSMVGINPAEAYGAIASGDLGKLSKDSMIKYQNFFRQFSGTDIASKNTRAILAEQMGIDAELADQLANNTVSLEEAFAQFGSRSKGLNEQILQIMKDLEKKQYKFYEIWDLEDVDAIEKQIKVFSDPNAANGYIQFHNSVTNFLSKIQQALFTLVWGKEEIIETNEDGSYVEKRTPGAFQSFILGSDLPKYTLYDSKGIPMRDPTGQEISFNASTETEDIIKNINPNKPFTITGTKDVIDSHRLKSWSNMASGGFGFLVNGKTIVTYDQETGELKQNTEKSLLDRLTDDMLGRNKEASGISKVPYDNYPALLHKDERVLNAAENVEYTQETTTARMALKQFIVNSAEHPLYVTFDQSKIERIVQILESQYVSNTPTQEETLQQELTTTSVPTSNDIYMYV